MYRLDFRLRYLPGGVPWNKKAKPHSEKDFQPLLEITLFLKPNWENLTPEVFEEIFRESPLRKTGFERIKRNIGFLKGTD